MNAADVMNDAFARIHGIVQRVVKGLTSDQLSFQVNAESNSIAWLIWHLTRIQDDHMADAAGTDQLWSSAGWADRFALPLDVPDTGYGHSPAQVAAVQVRSGDLLVDYHDAVHDETQRFVRGLNDSDLERIVDDSWDPPVSLGVRLVSVISDNLQHAGQASYVRGILPEG